MYAISYVMAFVANLEHKREEKGATAVEYGLLVALIAAVIVAVVATLGGEISEGFSKVTTELQKH